MSIEFMLRDHLGSAAFGFNVASDGDAIRVSKGNPEMKIQPLAMSWAVVCCIAAGSAVAADPPKTDPATHRDATDAAAKADNTKKNVRDRDESVLTPIDQPNNARDIELAAAVRSAIVKDDSLSTTAHNVKLIAADGVVVLRGPVKSADEKMRVEAIVKQVVGVTKVDSHLEIAH
jgi:hypothetical protein